MPNPLKDHWEQVYTDKAETEVSWYQARPAISLELIHAAGVPLSAPILDIGGGASTLAGFLLDAGYRDISVIDLSARALEKARARLGDRAGAVGWIEGDITGFQPAREYSIWHDRAVFHFLTAPEDRARYRASLLAALAPRGQVILATFGPEGPTKCSGLPIQRYSVAELCAFLGPEFELQEQRIESHRTPAGTLQQFVYGRWRRK